MKKAITFICFLILFGCKAQSDSLTMDKIEPELEKVVFEILRLAAKKDTLSINERYVHPAYGVYDVNRIGVSDTFSNYQSISFAFPDNERSTMYPNFNALADIEYDTELIGYHVNFDCNEMEWDRGGLFITNTFTYPKLTDVIAQPVFETSEFSESFLKQAKFIDENSYRFVLTEIEIIFFLTKIDGRWYITLLDRVTTDCSA